MDDANSGPSPGEKQPVTDAEKTAQREREKLRLSRAYVLQQIASSTNERYTDSLRRALSEIEQKLEQMEKARR